MARGIDRTVVHISRMIPLRKGTKLNSHGRGQNYKVYLHSNGEIIEIPPDIYYAAIFVSLWIDFYAHIL